MDHSEGKQEQKSRHNEKNILENRRRLESNRVADQRRGEHVSLKKSDKTPGGSSKLNEQSNRPQEKQQSLTGDNRNFKLSEEKRSGEKKLLEPTKTKDKKVPGKNYNANEIAELRRKKAGVQRVGDQRFEELARKKNLSTPEQQEIQKKLKTNLEGSDIHWREADRRTKEGMREFKENPKARRDFCHQAGVEEHKRWEKEDLAKEKKLGHQQGKDFGIEAVHQHPDGKPVRLDKVDYNKDTITDRKSLGENETEEQLKKKYEKQRQRHIEAYEHDTGRKVEEYFYSPYRSPKDLE